MTEDIGEFEAYLNYLAQELGHADRHAGLVLPLSRKSVEPIAAILIHSTRVRSDRLAALCPKGMD